MIPETLTCLQDTCREGREAGTLPGHFKTSLDLGLVSFGISESHCFLICHCHRGHCPGPWGPWEPRSLAWEGAWERHTASKSAWGMSFASFPPPLGRWGLELTSCIGQLIICPVMWSLLIYGHCSSRQWPGGWAVVCVGEDGKATRSWQNSVDAGTDSGLLAQAGLAQGDLMSLPRVKEEIWLPPLISHYLSQGLWALSPEPPIANLPGLLPDSALLRPLSYSPLP